MNEGIMWLANDKKVQELRDKMEKALIKYRAENPGAPEEAESRHLKGLFLKDSKDLMKEQLSIISSALK